MKYAFIPKPRYKKHTSKKLRLLLRKRLESQWRNWFGPGATKEAEYVAWMHGKQGKAVRIKLKHGYAPWVMT